MKTYTLVVVRSSYGTVEVKANCLDEALNVFDKGKGSWTITPLSCPMHDNEEWDLDTSNELLDTLVDGQPLDPNQSSFE